MRDRNGVIYEGSFHGAAYDLVPIDMREGIERGFITTGGEFVMIRAKTEELILLGDIDLDNLRLLAQHEPRSLPGLDTTP